MRLRDHNEPPCLLLSSKRSWDFENRAGIHAAADSRAEKRASLAEEHSAGGELVVAELEAENHALEPDSALLFQRENVPPRKANRAQFLESDQMNTPPAPLTSHCRALVRVTDE
jgi:hypothetical protein